MSERRRSDSLGFTHASFFSGVGGLDLGMERAGWKTVSFSEIDPYASGILAERWPGVPNLGNIVELRDAEQRAASLVSAPDRRLPGRLRSSDDSGEYALRHDWRSADLWSGGFPCQDLSVGGLRRGLAGSRSGLAFAFLDLVRLHRPRALLLENVEGLLTSNAGRDLAALFHLLVELGYGWAFRLVDSQFFGVPQRRRRVFILALDLARYPDERSAGSVLAIGTRCSRDHHAERQERKDAAARLAGSADRSESIFGNELAPAVLTTNKGYGRHYDSVVAPRGGFGNDVTGTFLAAYENGLGHNKDEFVVFDRSPRERDDFLVAPRRSQAHASGVGAADGLPGRLDDQHELVAEEGKPVRAFVKSRRAKDADDFETWIEGDVSPTLNLFDASNARATTVVTTGSPEMSEDEYNEHMNPAGIDGHRYRCCGNGVVSNVAEWIGYRIRTFLEDADAK